MSGRTSRRLWVMGAGEVYDRRGVLVGSAENPLRLGSEDLFCYLMSVLRQYLQDYDLAYRLRVYGDRKNLFLSTEFMIDESDVAATNALRILCRKHRYRQASMGSPKDGWRHVELVTPLKELAMIIKCVTILSDLKTDRVLKTFARCAQEFKRRTEDVWFQHGLNVVS